MVRPLLLKIPTRRAIQQILCASGARDMNNPLTSFCFYSDRCIAARLRRNRVSGQRGGLKSTPKARNVKTTCVANMISGCKKQRRVKSTVKSLRQPSKSSSQLLKGFCSTLKTAPSCFCSLLILSRPRKCARILLSIAALADTS